MTEAAGRATRLMGFDAATTAPTPSTWRMIATFAICGLLWRVALVLSGACDAHVIADDTFYYLTIARNAAAGLGPTFDGMHPTNGFHPLYLLLLIPVFRVGALLHAGPWALTHAALVMDAFLDTATGIVACRLLRKAGAAGGAPWFAGVWFFSPWYVLLTLRGLETSLDLLMLALWLLVLLELLQRPRPAAAIVLGLLSGLAFLARTDNGVLLPPVAIVAWWVAPRGTRGRIARHALLIAVVAALVVAPWFAWTLRTFHVPWQVSGRVKLEDPWIFGHLPFARGLTPGLVLYALVQVVISPAAYLAGELHASVGMVIALCEVSIVGLVMLAPFARGAFAHLARRPLAAALSAFALLHAALYGLALRNYANWYAAAPLLGMLVLLVGLGIGPRLETARPAVRRLFAAVIVGGTLAVYGVFFRASGYEPRGQGRDAGAFLTQVERQYPAVRRVGMFNAGAAGYFAPAYGPLRIVALDGLVNNAAYDARRQGRYLDYLLGNVDLIVVDAPDDLRFWIPARDRTAFEQHFPRQGHSLVFGPAR